MGLVQYSAKFTPDVASVAKPIQELTRQGVAFNWGEEPQMAFQGSKLKKSLGCLLATNWRNLVARCKFLVASLYNQKIRILILGLVESV